MVFFPVLDRLTVEGYGLYPGPDNVGHFEIEFKPGLTLILGANGLGKTTLMILLYRMLSGTFELALPEGSIGNANLEAFELSSRFKGQFGARVNDGAREATARLRFLIDTQHFDVERRLFNLALARWSIDGVEQDGSELDFQRAILTASGMGSFTDWLLVLRTLVFFFEDRRALVWDFGAQRQLLRCLFLSPERAAEWTNQEREILELDSRLRNLQAAVRKEQRKHEEERTRIESEPGVREALAAAEKRRERLQTEHDTLIQRVEIAEASRQRARLDALRAQSDHDQAVRELERARLMAIEACLPKAEESVRFILARLMSDNQCLVCGTQDLQTKRQELENALHTRHCVVCASPLVVNDSVTDLSNERLVHLQEQVEGSLSLWQAKQHDRDAAQCEFDADSIALAERSSELADVAQLIRNLVNSLPADERGLAKHYERFKELEGLLTELRDRLQRARLKFGESLDSYRYEIEGHAQSIKTQFQVAAEGFLFEESTLSWSPVKRLVGQAGGEERVEYPAFAIELSGSDFGSMQRRDDPSQVSESQREFIDLAFRMALMKVASPSRGATLAIDAPESSLDAVFVDRAANVLARFAAETGNRLVITSNLGAGTLVPELLKQVASPGQREDLLVDLFKSGRPTRAMEMNRASYDAYFEELMMQIGDMGTGD
jgi:energy-coupling factor transporter ATP-binding protein EcfA2